MKNKKIIATLVAFSLILGIGACHKKSDDDTTEATAETTTEATTTTTEATTTTEETMTEPTIDDMNGLYDPSLDKAVNPYTGIQDMDPENVDHRGVSVVINNTFAALPQRGISQADILYEYETEGGQTRMLISFADINTVPEVGSLRSARILSTDLAAGLNSVFIHYGRNARVPDHIAAWGIDHIDGNNCSAGRNSSASATDGYVELPSGLFFWRDATWLSQRALEHTAVSDGVHIAEAIEHYDIDMTYENAPLVFNFVPGDSADLEDAEDCTVLDVYFSTTNDDAEFTYSPETGLYYKTQYNGKPQIDETTDDQIAVTNVFIIFVDIQMNADGYTVDAYFENGGTGYYVSDGKIVPITWTKPTPNDPITIFNADGEEVEVNRGKSYVCIVDNDEIDNQAWSDEDTSNPDIVDE